LQRAIICGLALALLSCAPPSQSGSQGTPSPYVQVQKAGEHTATLTIAPYPPALMEEVPLILTVQDAQGRPVLGATVQLDLTMPGMEMPPNHPEAVEEGNGRYRAPAVFTMAGAWQVRAEVIGQDGKQEFIFHLRTR